METEHCLNQAGLLEPCGVWHRLAAQYLQVFLKVLVTAKPLGHEHIVGNDDGFDERERDALHEVEDAVHVRQRRLRRERRENLIAHPHEREVNVNNDRLLSCPKLEIKDPEITFRSFLTARCFQHLSA
eukprot:3496509-Rhodomonas_salina.1